MKHIFKRGWRSKGGGQTVCGWGSEIEHTGQIRKKLPEILAKYNVKLFNDAGCGDLNWISTIELGGDIDYMGYDLISRARWNCPLKCLEMDVSEDFMRKADMILCRDVFIHLPNDSVKKILNNFKQSSDLLLTTNFMDCSDNGDRLNEPSIKYAKINLSIEPFNLGEPIICVQEDYPNKCTCLWRLK